MFLFEAHYINMEIEEETTKLIEVDGQFFDSEKECYLCAMSKAYDLIEDYEMFCSLKFIAC